MPDKLIQVFSICIYSFYHNFVPSSVFIASIVFADGVLLKMETIHSVNYYSVDPSA